MQRTRGLASAAAMSLLIPALLLAACGRNTGPTTPAEYRDLEGPIVVATVDDGDLETKWAELTASAADLGRSGGTPGDEAEAIPGFEPFNDPRIALSDGRFLVRGRWDGDQPIAGWVQRNPASVPEGEDNPVVENAARPVRLFVYDPARVELQPVSHIPAVHPYSTAVYVGESADAVLEIVVLRGEEVAAYTSGFNGAAYDIPREVYVAPIPRRGP